MRGFLLTVCPVLLLAAPHSANAGDSSQSAAQQREAAVRSRGRFFSKVAVAKNFSGEWVISRTSRTTAFLDIADPRHPRTRAKDKTKTERIHILVVPNQAREHIAKALGGKITESDIKAATTVFKEARLLAKRLGIRKPAIYANSESRVGVGYFHVHIEGALPAKSRLPRLKK